MSVAKALNLSIALVEENPEAARSISRTLPWEDMKGLCTATSRLSSAVRVRELKAAFAALEDIQKFTMVLEPEPDWPPARTQAWFEGIAQVETWIDTKIESLRLELGMDKYEPADR